MRDHVTDASVPKGGSLDITLHNNTAVQNQLNVIIFFQLCFSPYALFHDKSIMASRRKPVPRIQSPANDPHEPVAHQHAIVDPQITRYSLSDAPTPTYDNFDNEVDQLLQSFPENQSPNNQIDPFQTIASSLEGHANVERPEQPALYSQPIASEYQPYQPGQYLAPIITGETLQLDPVPPQPTSVTHSDPFYDPTTPLSSVHAPLSSGHSEYYYSQPQGYAPPSEQSHVTYDANHLQPEAEINHFNHDTEAYASGNYSRASYRPPRSRSPTPAPDDEDYYIVGNESVHHTGYPGYPQDGYGAEKEAKHSSYYNERGYLSNGHAVVYDPEPETPTSTLYSLPQEGPAETRHFGPAPTGRVLRRHKTKRRVQLTNGNLVVDLDVPPKLQLPRKGEPETMKTRYTAVTCDPDDFEKKGFFLRQNESGRRTELFIVITMYNVSLSE